MKANYYKILKMHEKDNPSPFCRASYLISNTGDMIKCYGRMLRFPNDAHIYKKEMELAMGDVIMQCRLVEEEYHEIHHKIDGNTWDSIEGALVSISANAALLMDHLTREMEHVIHKNGHDQTTRETINNILDGIGNICTGLHLDFNKVEHLGFIHTIERFKEFERRGWK